MVSHASTEVSGITTLDSSFIFMDQSSLGVEEAIAQDIGIELMPNPTTDVLSMTFGAVGQLSMTIHDPMGRKVMLDDLGQLPPGIHRHIVDVRHLPAGRYVVRLVNGDGRTGTRPFIVQR